MNKNLIETVLVTGGLVKYKGVSVYVDNPDNLVEYSKPSGFYIKSPLNFNIYFKTGDRAKAQDVCNSIFGKSAYTVQRY